MTIRLAYLLPLVLLAGCHPAAPSAGNDNVSKEAVNAPSTGGGAGIAPMASGAATGMSPVSGSESVEGAGMGGLGDSAKSAARKAAAGAGAPAGAGGLDQDSTG